MPEIKLTKVDLPTPETPIKPIICFFNIKSTFSKILISSFPYEKLRLDNLISFKKFTSGPIALNSFLLASIF